MPHTGWCFGINSLLVLVIVRHTDKHEVAGFGTAALFAVSVGGGAFLAAVVMPAAAARWGRYATANGALAAAAVVQLAGSGLELPMMIGCGFLLGLAGQVVKLCADSAMQLDVDDALRGHVFTVQDAAVLDVVHPRNHVGGERDSTRRPPTGAGPGGRRGVPAWLGSARRDRQALLDPGLR